MNQSASSPPRSRKQPLLRRSLSTPSLKATCGGGTTAAEFCGGATASCAALWCCGPCSVVNLVVLAVYKVPRGIYRRLRRRKLTKKGILPPAESGDCEKKHGKVGSSQFAVHPLENKEYSDFYKSATAMDLTEGEGGGGGEGEEDEAVNALEKEMWSRFNSGGFWRSLSRVETPSFSISD